MDQHARHEITRQWLIDQLRDDPDVPSDAAAGVQMLAADGMLVEFDPAHGPLKEMFERHRLHPCGVALGNTADRPDVFTVVNGDHGVTLSFVAFHIWASAYRSTTLWQACLDFVDEVTATYQPPEQPPDGLTVDTVAGEIAAALPPLIAARCAFLDPAEESDSEYHGAVEQEYRG